MTDLLVALFEFVGFVGFAVAFVYSYKNFRMTRHISVTWLLLSVSMVFLALFTFFNFLEWMDIYPQVMDEIQNSIFPIAIVSIFTAVLVAHDEFLKPISR